jgi:hypothetical protein
MSRSQSGRSAQSGFSVMLALVIIALAVGSLAVTFLSTFGTKARSDRVTETALAKAKDALIAYAASNAATTNSTRYGALPCPDATNDGYYKTIDDTTGSNCKLWVGRLPWATLGLEDLRDGNGERLWYAISPSFQPNPSGTGVLPLNSDTLGQLTVTGITPDTNVVGVIFAPGNPVGTQSRTPASVNDPLQYLESTNATSTTNFVAADPSPTFNDRLITIRPAEIFRLIEKQVGPALRPLLAQYYLDWGRYPFAVPFGDPTGSNFRGQVGVYEGLLPVPATNPVTWDTVNSTISAGLITLPLPIFNSCVTASAGDLLSCTTFALSLLGLGTNVTITAYANNVGMAFVDPVPTSAVTINPPLTAMSITQSMDAAGRATIQVTGQLSAPIAFLGTFTTKIARPQRSAWLDTSWLTTNNWQNVSYYAIAPGFAPSGANSCAPSTSPCNPVGVLPATACLSLCDSRLANNLKANNIRALLVTTGPALSALLAHPSANLSRYLEAGNQSVPDGTYEGGLITNTFNDQASVLAPYP